MDDLISRQAAIDAICKEGTRLERNGTVAMCEIKQWCIDLLERLPSAQPERTQERKTGKWIYCEDTIADSVDGYRCDQCGFFVPWDYQHKSIDYIKDYNFCPNCGAKMEDCEA